MIKIAKLYSIFILIVLSLNVQGEDKNLNQELPTIWKEGKSFYPFFVNKETKALVSSLCIDKDKECMALNAVKNKLKITFTEEQRAGGKNPASLICSIGYKGIVLVLQDADGNENSFCKFPDNSIVSASDLR